MPSHPPAWPRCPHCGCLVFWMLDEDDDLYCSHCSRTLAELQRELAGEVAPPPPPRLAAYHIR